MDTNTVSVGNGTMKLVVPEGWAAKVSDPCWQGELCEVCVTLSRINGPEYVSGGAAGQSYEHAAGMAFARAMYVFNMNNWGELQGTGT